MASTTLTNVPVQPRQNWVVGQYSDVLFIIAAPVLSFIWAIAFSLSFGAEAVFAIFAVFNVAHHLPTFIRIYGDQDLMRRFRWSLLLGPLLPFSLAMAVASYVVLGGFHMSSMMYLMMILQFWDPWHFLMQHYGFMRIYDRHNKVRREIAARMDLLICATWFVHIMVATIDWLPDALYDTYRYHGFPLIFLFDSGVYAWLELATLGVALIATVVYVGYVLWCAANGYFVSRAKLLLLIITFGIMYLTYVPNALVARWLPNWSFALGFAVLGMVHVTQYLAIVWKYNRSLAARGQAARPGMFQRLFSHGGWTIATLFVGACLLYGFCLTYIPHGTTSDRMPMRWTIGVLFAMSFTSTLLHYYYDGFIWKVRHKENQQNLGIRSESGDDQPATRSWWDGVSPTTARGAFLRQCAYFLPPILLLTASYWILKSVPVRTSPIIHLVTAEGVLQTQVAIAAMEDQLKIERQMIQIRPRARHFTYQADLLYMLARSKLAVAQQLGSLTIQQREESRQMLSEAIQSLEMAIRIGPPFGHHEQRKLSREEIDERLFTWGRELEEFNRAFPPSQG